jgi:hypothetical protein
VAVEKYGPSTAEELASVMEYSRVRDFRRKHLDVLVERGDLVERDGVYARPGDYAERMQAERHAAYSSWKRRRVSADPQSGTLTHWVEYGPEKSDIERDADDLGRYKEHRRRHRKFLEKKHIWFQDPANSLEDTAPQRSYPSSKAGDELCRELLNARDEERQAPPGEAPEGDAIASVAEVFDLARAFFGEEVA